MRSRACMARLNTGLAALKVHEGKWWFFGATPVSRQTHLIFVGYSPCVPQCISDYLLSLLFPLCSILLHMFHSIKHILFIFPFSWWYQNFIPITYISIFPETLELFTPHSFWLSLLFYPCERCFLNPVESPWLIAPAGFSFVFLGNPVGFLRSLSGISWVFS